MLRRPDPGKRRRDHLSRSRTTVTASAISPLLAKKGSIEGDYAIALKRNPKILMEELMERFLQPAGNRSVEKRPLGSVETTMRRVVTILTFILIAAFSPAAFASPITYTFDGRLSSGDNDLIQALGFTSPCCVSWTVALESTSDADSSPNLGVYDVVSSIVTLGSTTFDLTGSFARFRVGNDYDALYFDTSVSGMAAIGGYTPDVFGLSLTSNEVDIFASDALPLTVDPGLFTTEMHFMFRGATFGAALTATVDDVTIIAPAPVPEPATLLLVGSGCTTLLFRRRRSR